MISILIIQIDVNGKVVFKIISDGTYVSNVSDGVFCVERNHTCTYYDVTGKELTSYGNASGFYDGYAFISTKSLEVDVIDRNFNIIRHVPEKCFNSIDIGCRSPKFTSSGFAVVNKSCGGTVINTKGEVVLDSYSNRNGTNIDGYRKVSECGYIIASASINKKFCIIYVKTTGEIVWVFTETKHLDLDKSPLPEAISPGPQFSPKFVDPEQPAIGKSTE